MLKKMMIVIMMLCMTCTTAYASDVGSLDLTFNNEKTSHISFSVYKIGDLIDGSTVDYQLAQDFDTLDVDINNLKTSADMQAVIDDCLTHIDVLGLLPYQSRKGGDDGNVHFDHLDLGMYLVVQDSEYPTFISESFIITVPLLTDAGLAYNIKTEPKYTDIIPEKEEETEDEDIVTTITGDKTRYEIYILTMLISTVMFVFIYLFTKKNKESKV